MSPESINVSLEWAKKLKEAGWPQHDALFYHHQVCKPFKSGEPIPTEVCYDPEYEGGFFSLAAPNAEEILRKLPTTIRKPLGDGRTSSPHRIRIARVNHGENEVWAIRYQKHTSPKMFGPFSASDASLSDAAAAMYCVLKENRLLTDSN